MKNIIPTIKSLAQRFKWFIPVLILGIGALIASMLVATKPEAVSKPKTETTWPVQVSTVSLQTHTPQLVLYGKVESRQTSQLTAAINAFVNKTLVEEGQLVKKGEPLVLLERQEQELIVKQRQADVAEAEAEIIAKQNQYQTDLTGLQRETALFEIAQSELTRQKALREKKLNSKAQLEAAQKSLEQQGLALGGKKLAVKNHESELNRLQARLDKNQALLEQALLDLDRTVIKSPYNGKITKRHVSEGNRVLTGNPIIELFELDSLQVRAQIPTVYLTKVQDALQNGTLNAKMCLDEQCYPLALKRLAGEVDANRGGVEGLFDLVEKNHRFALGRSVKITLDLIPIANSVLIPGQAVYDADRIYTLVEERMQPIKVDIHGEKFLSDGHAYMIVTSQALNNDDTVVITQLPNAIKGLKVKVINQ